MCSISTSLQRLCFVHTHSGILLTSLRLLTSIHLSGALACTLVIRHMLGELIISNRWVRSPAFLWCAPFFESSLSILLMVRLSHHLVRSTTTSGGLLEYSLGSLPVTCLSALSAASRLHW
jgi:hypothetical protein